MTAYEYMQKQVRGISGGIAWPQHVFTASPKETPETLVDVAVDIAWERLLPPTPERPELDIEKHGNLIVFRPRPVAVEPTLTQAA